MTTQQMLIRIKQLHKLIIEAKYDAQRYEAKAQKITTSFTGNEGSHTAGSYNATEKRFIDYAQSKSDKLKKLLGERDRLQLILQELIDKLDDSTDRQALKLYYIDNRNYGEIAKIIKYSYNYTRQFIMNRAEKNLFEFQKVNTK